MMDKNGSFSEVSAARTVAASTAGYSLIELLVVLGIIALIASLATPQILGYLGSARVETAKTQIRNIESALELYFLDHDRYPTTDEGIAALAVKPASSARWNGPYLKGADHLADPWGNPYGYDAGSDRFTVLTFGRDGKLGGTGQDADLTN